jgi:hypothetical protein
MKLAVEESMAESVSIDPSTSVFVVRNSSLERLLLDRSLVGLEFRRVCLMASRLFLRHLVDEVELMPLAELIILSKGLVYQLGEAYAVEVGKNLPTNLVATMRVGVEGNAAKVDVPYARLDAGGDALIIGDTVASGSTVIAALEEYIQHHRLSKVYLVSYAGSVLGARNVAAFCRSREIEIVIMYGLAAFGLGGNGFDLSFLHPETLARDEYVQRARSLYGNNAISAIGWDFGSQQMAPDKYRSLAWVESQVFGVDGSVFGSVEPVESPDALWRERDAFINDVPRVWPEES